MDTNDPLAVLVGGHFDTVSFVMDYVEIRTGHSARTGDRTGRAIMTAVIDRRDEAHAREIADFLATLSGSGLVYETGRS